MGFNDRWVGLIMVCVSLVSYSILVNGHSQLSFMPTKGLKLGDPLSPYLFILCVESLSNLLSKAEKEGSITSMQLGSGRLRVIHLFFADDS